MKGELIEKIHSVDSDFDGIIINPAAFTHTSIALLDALRATSKPKIEIHISNIYAREDYRRKSITSEAVNGVICGFGENGYVLAIDAIKNLIYSEI
jgi:3-dehydroquinate dehydratase-2